uniref:Uncharacterized protein n=1 Tax=Heterorhabditis bacteriophora TaxID=37862 RepID=A0A1I7WS71_HETBA
MSATYQGFGGLQASAFSQIPSCLNRNRMEKGCSRVVS